MAERTSVDWSPVDARLVRAQHHVDDLDAAVKRFAALPPYSRRRTATSAGTIVERADTILPAPRDFSMIASDAIHQARAALDNAVGVIRPGGPTGTSAFPVVHDETRFAAKAATLLGGVPAWAIDTIRSYQPFAPDHGGLIGGQLANLHEVARLDRHRAPAISVALLRPDSAAGTVIEFRTDWATWAEVEYRAGEVAWVRFEVEVRFADGPLADFDLPSSTAWLVRIAAEVIEQLKKAERS